MPGLPKAMHNGIRKLRFLQDMQEYRRQAVFLNLWSRILPVCIAVARKYSVLTEIIDIFTQVCKVCIHDEDVAETDFEYTFKTPKGF